MPYRIKRKETVRRAVRRIVREQLERAVVESRERERSLDERVHQVRARLKRARAALRLVCADGLAGRARREDRFMRNVARGLAGSRDATVETETLRGLVQRFGPELPRAAEGLARMQERVARREASRKVDGQLGTAVDKLRARRREVGHWSVQAGRRAVERGIRVAYRDARRLARALRVDDPAERFHDWRKTVKRLGYQLRLLRDAAPELWWTLGSAIERLGELLGAAHDLASLRARVAGEPELFGPPADRKALLVVVDRESAALHSQARALGAEVFSARPREIAARVDRAWYDWRRAAERE
jgi:CHAD domain-containing protein